MSANSKDLSEALDQLILLKRYNVNQIIVFLNKIDIVQNPQQIENILAEIKLLLDLCDFDRRRKRGEYNINRNMFSTILFLWRYMCYTGLSYCSQKNDRVLVENFSKIYAVGTITEIGEL